MGDASINFNLPYFTARFYYFFTTFCMFFAPEMIVLALELKKKSRLRHIFSPNDYFYNHSWHLFQFARSSDFNLPFQFTVRSWLFNLPPTIRDFNLPIDCPSGNVDLPSVWDFNLPSQHDFNLPSDNFNLPGCMISIYRSSPVISISHDIVSCVISISSSIIPSQSWILIYR